MSQLPSQNNLIYPWLVDFLKIDRVFQYIDALPDPHVQASKLRMHAAHGTIKKRLSQCENASAKDIPSAKFPDWKALSAEELCAFSDEITLDVYEFVVSAMNCYRVIRTARSFTPEEREHGQILRELLTSMQKMLPALPPKHASLVTGAT